MNSLWTLSKDTLILKVVISVYSLYDVMVSMLALHPRGPGFNPPPLTRAKFVGGFSKDWPLCSLKNQVDFCNVATIKCYKPVSWMCNVIWPDSSVFWKHALIRFAIQRRFVLSLRNLLRQGFPMLDMRFCKI